MLLQADIDVMIARIASSSSSLWRVDMSFYSATPTDPASSHANRVLHAVVQDCLPQD